MNKNISEFIGWYGTIAIVIGYFLISFNFVNSSNLVYQLLNLTGAAGIVTISFYKKTYQSGVLNLIWLIIAAFAIFKIIFH